LPTPTSSKANIIVLGAGVIGLTSAVALLEEGFRVRIIATHRAPDITSSIAAGLWYPYAVEGKAVPRLAVATLRRYKLLAKDPDTGVRLVPCQWAVPTGDDKTFWADEDVGYSQDDNVVSAMLPVADAAVFLPWLSNRIAELGGLIEIDPTPVADLDDLPDDLIVNCTGLGSRRLCNDHRLYPIKGTVVLVENPGIDYCVADDQDPALPTYIIPLSTGLVLGGTAEVGEWDLTVDEAQTNDIVQRCAQLEPRVRGSRVLASRSGLRPGRDEVRLEKESRETGKIVIHNYGHGGSGYTLAWGCAEEVVRMVKISS